MDVFKYKPAESNGIQVQRVFQCSARASVSLERYYSQRTYVRYTPVAVYLCMPAYERRYDMDNEVHNATITRSRLKLKKYLEERSARI